MSSDDKFSKEQSGKSFEQDLDEFFKDRALFRAQTFSDSSKKTVSSERQADEMSGCCMTGCFDCPWGYEPQSAKGNCA
jgi:hypothetical protein